MSPNVVAGHLRCQFVMALLLAGVGFLNEPPTAQAQYVGQADSVVQGLARQIEELKQEVAQLKEHQQAADPNAAQGISGPESPSCLGENIQHQQSTCCSCQRFPCQCPLAEAPCLECPRVSTVRPYFNVNVIGVIKLDMLLSDPRPIAAGTPFFLSPGSAFDFEQNTFDVHARQSTLGLALSGPEFRGWKAGGLVVALFFNDAVILDQYGLLPLQAWGELRNENWRFSAGLQFDVFAPGIPTVLPFSALTASGNVGNSFRGQVRLERFLHFQEGVQGTIQVALSEPINSTIDGAFELLSEDNGWPNVEGRVALGLGPLVGEGAAAKRPFELGLSGVIGQIRSTNIVPADATRVVADVWGVALDLRWQVSEFWGVAGEVFTGQTLGTYNGGILQTINADTLSGVRTSGAWGEVFFHWTPCLESHLGYGIDDPIDRDVAAAAGRGRNEVYFANLLWELNKSFLIGFEFTWRETVYTTLADNEGAAVQTQFRWSF